MWIITMIDHFPPGLVLILGALVVPLLRGHLRNIWVISMPALGFLLVYSLPFDTSLQVPFIGFDLELLRVDKTAKAFGYIFTLSSFAAFIYGYYQKGAVEFTGALFYVGASLMVVFAGDLVTLYIFWEVMAVTSVMLVLSRKTKKAYQAGSRYIMVHVFGGLVLLAGLLLTIKETGSTAFNAFDPANATMGTWLILAGFLINAAALPLSSWLPDAYPESTVMGGVILSAYTSKTAVYTLIRGFPGWDILIIMGCAMSLYGIIYALLENDMRRILAYSIINQVGFMVCAVGIGTTLALNGAIAHAFCHIIYKALLWMSAGAVLYRVGKSKCTDLGGLYNTMPWTLIMGGVGALAISSVPLTSGFTSKTIIIMASANEHLFWAWLVLEIASAGVFLHAGIKFPYFVFFAKDKGLRPKEAPKTMLAAMGFLAFFCIYLGMFPEWLYNILPDTELVKASMPYTFKGIYIEHFAHVVTQSQMLIFSGLVFFLFLPLLKRTDTIAIDIDWFYRKGARLVYLGLDRGLNTLNTFVNRLVAEELIDDLALFFKNGPANIAMIVSEPFYKMYDVSSQLLGNQKQKVYRKFSLGNFTIASTAIFSVLFLLMLLML